ADMEAPTDEPEIPPRDHDALVHWALATAYSTRDMEGSASERAVTDEAEFIKRFGRLDDANVRRKMTRLRAPVTRPVRWCPMAARDLDLSKISQFIGPNNRDEETAVAPNVLRELSDADLTKAGKIRSRKGYTEALVPCTLGHSLWADHRGLFPFGLYVDD